MMSSTKDYTSSTRVEGENSTTGKSNGAPAHGLSESWRLCMEQKWTTLQMRLGMFPDEARQVQEKTKRSLLHEVVLSSGDETVAAATGNALRHTANKDLVTPLLLRGVYFSCPQAMLLQDSSNGYTPLHCALVKAASALASPTTTSDDGSTGSDTDTRGQHHTTFTPMISFFELICILLEMSHRRFIVNFNEDSDDEEEDSLLFEDDDDEDGEAAEYDNDDIHEDAVMLLQDHLGDTPLHTACRHGCSKRILQVLMTANPPALFQYNKDGMTPLRLLWSTLDQSMGTSNSNSNRLNPVVAKEASPSHQQTSSLLEDIIINKIHNYNDLIQYPSIHETWEISMMFLHIHRMASFKSYDTNGGRGEGGGVNPSIIQQSMTQDERSTLIINNSLVDELMPNDIYGSFLKRVPYQTNYQGAMTADSSQQGAVTSQEKVRTKAGKRKRKLVSFHAMELNSSKKLEVKGVEPDEHGMLPISSYMIKPTGSHEDKEDESFYPKNNGALSEETDDQDELNLFFGCD